MAMIRLVLALYVGTACSGVWSQTVQEIEQELKLAFEADQSSRRNGQGPEDPCGDDLRRMRVLELLAEGLVVTVDGKYYAAMILQHTPQFEIGGELISMSAENYMLAHLLAKSAAAEGHKGARSLVPRTIDRYLVSQGLPQKYGTQFTLNPKTRRLEFSPVDPVTTDEEREQWGVPPVASTLESWQGSPAAERVVPQLPRPEVCRIQ